MTKAQKNRASKHAYQSPTQFVLEGFETPFSRNLRQDNRWVKLAHQIPWDILVETYQKQLKNDATGASGINPRVVIGSMIIKHMCNLSDRETVQLIQENIYMQYFIGYTSFSDEEPFDASLFVEFRKRLGIEQINAINEKILGLNLEQKDKEDKDENNNEPPENEGTLILDATACPQDIAYPTDLNLLNDAREKAEYLIDVLFDPNLHQAKPRNYREKARKLYLNTAQKKIKSKKVIRTAIKQQLNFLKRNIQNIYRLMEAYGTIPLDRYDYKYWLVIQTLYDQQNKMFKEETHSVDHRIVSIHQPHVRPIVRGKSNANVEFGAKIQVSLMNGYAFLDDLQWEAFNEGTRLEMTIDNFKRRFGCYPKVVMADKIYCNRQNRAWLKTNGIELRAKPLGRPPAVKTEHVSPGERNPIEGKFGQAKTAYGLNRIMARLQETSESWIATIIMVLNLVKLTGEAPYRLLVKLNSFSAKHLINLINKFIDKIRCYLWKFELSLN
jgi:hypothetical protein